MSPAANKCLNGLLHYNKGDVTSGKQVLEWLLPLANKKFNFGALKKSVNDGEILKSVDDSKIK